MSAPAATRAAQRVGAAAADLVALSHQIHDVAELGFEETQSVAIVAALLDRNGIRAEIGGWNLPTALRAQVGDSGPRVGIFAEYDALPGIGHACGHNVICASAVGAFLGLAEIIDEVGGTVVLFGTPAEENGSGKELMARAGAFDDLDAAVMLHPTSGRSLANGSSSGLRSVEVTYHGRAAHAAAAPHAGRNALDAIVLAYQGIAAMRQHILATDRIHGVIQEGGQAANIVPERARGRFLMRSADASGLAELSQRVQDILDGAALMTETQLDARWDQILPNLPIRSNEALAERFAAHLTARGHDVDRTPTATPGSTDLGNISLRLPAIHPWLAIAPRGVDAHTTEFASYAASESADTALVDGAIALAGTVADYLTDAELRATAADEFESAGGAVDVESLMSAPTSRLLSE